MLGILNSLNGQRVSGQQTHRRYPMVGASLGEKTKPAM